jgi:hypothetical protein
VTNENLRSEIESISSIASETKLFIVQIHERKVTNTFASGHLKYLRDESDETLHDLLTDSGSNENDAILREARTQATELSEQLASLSESVTNPNFGLGNRIDEILHKSQRLQAFLP